MTRTIALLLVLILADSLALADEPKASASQTLAFNEMLFLSPAGGGGGRNSIPTDPLLEKRIAGTWQAPKAGDSFTLTEGTTRKWETGKPDDKGIFRHAALRGGFAYAEITSPQEQVMILEASGHSSVYVNGEPQPGDVYDFGIVKVPVLLHKGTNAFLFRGGRGQLRAKLTSPTAPVMFNTADATLPDVSGEGGKEYWASAIVLNATTIPQRNLFLEAKVGNSRASTIIPDLAPLTAYKAPFLLKILEPTTAPNVTLDLAISDGSTGDAKPGQSAKVLSNTTFTLAVRKPDQPHKRTFKSSIDDSVQYFAVTPALPDPKITPPGLILTLHGAGVEAAGQAPCYSRKPGFYVVAPTNRRSYGFDWEDWGRLDALEVLELAQKEFGTNPRRTYLTGHSMGGARYVDRGSHLSRSLRRHRTQRRLGQPVLIRRPTTHSATHRRQRTLTTGHGAQRYTVAAAQYYATRRLCLARRQGR